MILYLAAIEKKRELSLKTITHFGWCNTYLQLIGVSTPSCSCNVKVSQSNTHVCHCNGSVSTSDKLFQSIMDEAVLSLDIKLFLENRFILYMYIIYPLLLFEP